jgi:hypothetical protein
VRFKLDHQTSSNITLGLAGGFALVCTADPVVRQLSRHDSIQEHPGALPAGCLPCLTQPSPVAASSSLHLPPLPPPPQSGSSRVCLPSKPPYLPSCIGSSSRCTLAARTHGTKQLSYLKSPTLTAERSHRSAITRLPLPLRYAIPPGAVLPSGRSSHPPAPGPAWLKPPGTVLLASSLTAPRCDAPPTQSALQYPSSKSLSPRLPQVGPNTRRDGARSRTSMPGSERQTLDDTAAPHQLNRCPYVLLLAMWVGCSGVRRHPRLFIRPRGCPPGC